MKNMAFSISLTAQFSNNEIAASRIYPLIKILFLNSTICTFSQEKALSRQLEIVQIQRSMSSALPLQKKRFA
tara:strand:- start:1206 stop:1421 length:216 start_codon:yes stop_codon:yes gene_type:complete